MNARALIADVRLQINEQRQVTSIATDESELQEEADPDVQPSQGAVIRSLPVSSSVTTRSSLLSCTDSE